MAETETGPRYSGLCPTNSTGNLGECNYDSTLWSEPFWIYGASAHTQDNPTNDSSSRLPHLTSPAFINHESLNAFTEFDIGHLSGSHLYLMILANCERSGYSWRLYGHLRRVTELRGIAIYISRTLMLKYSSCTRIQGSPPLVKPALADAFQCIGVRA
jgi:hypothetical protein